VWIYLIFEREKYVITLDLVFFVYFIQNFSNVLIYSIFFMCEFKVKMFSLIILTTLQINFISLMPIKPTIYSIKKQIVVCRTTSLITQQPFLWWAVRDPNKKVDIAIHFELLTAPHLFIHTSIMIIELDTYWLQTNLKTKTSSG
jgi:hypothetical protein